MIKQKSSSNEYPRELMITTPTMILVIDKNTIEKHTDEDENVYYTWEEDKYTPSEYVEKVVKENITLKEASAADNEAILDLDFRLSQLEE